MARYVILLIPFLLGFISCGNRGGNATTGELTSLGEMEHLDSIIAMRPALGKLKRQSIDSLWLLNRKASTPRERFEVLEKLFKAYRSYSMDSMLMVARMCRQLSREELEDSSYWHSVIMEAEGLKGMGSYNGAIALLDSIPRPWRQTFRRSLLQRYSSIYYSLMDYALFSTDSLRYLQKLASYRDSVIAESRPGSVSYHLNMAEKLRVEGNPQGALEQMDSISLLGPRAVDPGIEAFIRGKCHEDINDLEGAKLYFARAAAYDLSKSVRKYEALQELARLLSNEGDAVRAYQYIMCAIEDIQACNARSRFQRLASYQPIIAAAYAETQHRSNRAKTVLLGLAILFAVGLLVAVVFIRRKNTRLAREWSQLQQKNLELEQLRTRLSEANRNLEQSAKIKEDYLGYLFNLCSEYIDSLESYRRQMHQRLKSGNITDVERFLSSQQGGEHLQSFFKKFDEIILDIFPDFIEKINALMQPGYELQPKPGELLSPELRIYALVRLGVTDSTRIASFLHYSPQTVYNYRFRVRSHSLLPKEEFPRAVRRL